MSEVTSPLALDETLQQVAAKLGAISFSEVTGQTGKSAYASAQDGGFTGTEAEFNSEIAKMPTIIRPNLLRNWYFVGGGSQQGGGQFPINQKGQTVYTAPNNSYISIDIWCLENGVSLTIYSDSIVADNIYQYVGKFAEYLQKTLTISCLYTDGTLLFATATLPSTAPSSWTTYIDTTYLRIAYDGGKLRSQLKGISSSKKPIAAKLELGDTQTLCHNEGTEANPVWVLNEIPNFTEELWKCQRYYQLFASSSYRPTYGEDCRPPMATHNPSKGTISIGGSTYYYSDSTSALIL